MFFMSSASSGARSDVLFILFWRRSRSVQAAGPFSSLFQFLTTTLCKPLNEIQTTSELVMSSIAACREDSVKVLLES